MQFCNNDENARLNIIVCPRSLFPSLLKDRNKSQRSIQVQGVQGTLFKFLLAREINKNEKEFLTSFTGKKSYIFIFDSKVQFFVQFFKSIIRTLFMPFAMLNPHRCFTFGCVFKPEFEAIDEFQNRIT